jgi:hypothetical protein
MRWEGYVACMGEMRNANKILVGKFKGRNHLEGDNIKWILYKQGGGV